MRKLMKFFTLMVLVLVVAAGCTVEDQQGSDSNRRESVKTRENLFERAENTHPMPVSMTNFPMREALVKMTLRQDEINHPWYIYLYAMDGTPIGYYVGETYPQSMCNFLSDSTKFVDLPDQQWGQTNAPSADGVFYGGGGSSAACESMFFFDVTTDAMITFASPVWMSSDRPIPTFDGPALTESTVENTTPGEMVDAPPAQNPEEITPTPE